MDPEMLPTRTLFSFDTELTADSIECCSFAPYFACGTYQLNTEEKKQTRLGNIRLYRVHLENNHTEDEQNSTPIHVSVHQIIPTVGILDMKWTRNNSQDYLAAADSEGKVGLYELEISPSCAKTMLNLKCDLVVEVDGICLSLDYINPGEIVASTYKGNIVVIDNRTSEMLCKCEWKAHDFEAWICASDKWNENILYSGGDDCRFRGWDQRAGTSLLFSNKHHEMGVCSIQAHPRDENVICTGSYDENIRVFDKRNFKRPICLVNVGGGIWRLKWHPEKSELLLAACMHNGFKVVEMESSFDSGHVHAEYMEHGSLAYGSDWLISDQHKTETHLIGTCSFYDHLLKVWEF